MVPARGSRAASDAWSAASGAPRRLGLVAHYEGLPELADHGEMHVARDWYVGLAPFSGNRLNVGMALPMDGDRRVGRGALPGGDRGHPGRGGAPAAASSA